MGEKQTVHNYDFRTIKLFGTLFFWGRTDTSTDVLDVDEKMLFNLPFVADEDEVKIALYGWFQRELRSLFDDFT